MKRVMSISIISVLFISSQSFATILPGTTTDDYLPVVSVNVLTDNSQELVYQFQSIDEFEAEGSNYKLKTEKNINTSAAAITIDKLEFNPDPYVIGNVLVKNTSAVTQTYTFGFSLPTTLAVPNVIRGSVVVSLIDEAADGVTFSSTDGFPIYSAQIDFTEVATLLNDPYSLSGSTFVNCNMLEFGWIANNIAVNSNIGIELLFQISPGDSASILSRFEVAVPEPATLLLLGLGGLALLRKRR